MGASIFHPSTWWQSSLGKAATGAVGSALSLYGQAANDPTMAQYGANISDPSVNIAGKTNPGYTLGASTNTPSSPAQPTDTTTTATNLSNPAYGGGTGYNLNQYKNPVSDKISQLLAAYNSLNTNTDKSIQDQISRYNTSYDTQAKQLNDAFTNQQGQLSGAYAARGLGQSSFLGDAQGQAQNIYNTNIDQMTQGRNASLADIGRYGTQQHQSINDAIARYNDMAGSLGQYDTAEASQSGAGVAGLQNLNSQLGTALGSVNEQNAGLGTQADFIAKLQGIAPQANQGSNQLAEQLQKVVTSGAPTFAKNAIAQGLIKQAQLQDPNAQTYWNNYFQQQLSGQQ